MANAFDQFDQSSANPFDRFDAGGPAAKQQPSIWDRVMGLPPVRAIQANVVSPALNSITSAERMGTGALGRVGQIIEQASPLLSAFSTVGPAQARSFNDSLANTRNTPGYKAARTEADKVQALKGSGIGDQVVSTLTPSLAGAAGAPALVKGLATGLDTMNANADAQQEAQDAYHARHPIISTAANIAGGFLLAPKKAIPDALSAPRPAPVSSLRPGALDAHQAGYVLPPNMMSEDPGTVASTLSGWSGKIKTAQAASEANQEVSNSLAARGLGIDPETGITEKAIQDVRTAAGKAYKAVPDALPVTHQDQEFLGALGQIGDRTSSLAESFPNITKNQDIENLVGDLQNASSFKTEDGIALTRQLRSEANANFKAAADPKKLSLALAQRDAANALEDLIERNLSASNNEALMTDFRNARQQIAKSYDVEAATNTVTGNVNPLKLAALQARGRPLTGELKTIADAAAAFPKAMQPLDRFGGTEPLSTLDLLAAGASAAHGKFGLGAAILGKPIARSLALAPSMQARIAAKSQGLTQPLLAPLSFPGSKPIGLLPVLTQNASIFDRSIERNPN